MRLDVVLKLRPRSLAGPVALHSDGFVEFPGFMFEGAILSVSGGIVCLSVFAAFVFLFMGHQSSCLFISPFFLFSSYSALLSPVILFFPPAYPLSSLFSLPPKSLIAAASPRASLSRS